MWDWVKVYDGGDGQLLKFICGYLQQDLFLTSNTNKLSVRSVQFIYISIFIEKIDFKKKTIIIDK